MPRKNIDNAEPTSGNQEEVPDPILEVIRELPVNVSEVVGGEEEKPKKMEQGLLDVKAEDLSGEFSAMDNSSLKKAYWDLRRRAHDSGRQNMDARASSDKGFKMTREQQKQYNNREDLSENLWNRVSRMADEYKRRTGFDLGTVVDTGQKI